MADIDGNNSGSSSSGGMRVIVIVLIILAAVIAGLYFTSDVYRTRINAAANQYAHWTPENIAKDPENYLNFCEEEANKALLGLKASEISIAQNRGKLDAMQNVGEVEALAPRVDDDRAVGITFPAIRRTRSARLTLKGPARRRNAASRRAVIAHPGAGSVAYRPGGLRTLESWAAGAGRWGGQGRIALPNAKKKPLLQGQRRSNA